MSRQAVKLLSKIRSQQKPFAAPDISSTSMYSQYRHFTAAPPGFFVDKNTHIAGKNGTFHTEKAIEYGTKMRHNTIEHGRHMSRSKRNDALQCSTSGMFTSFVRNYSTSKIREYKITLIPELWIFWDLDKFPNMRDVDPYDLRSNFEKSLFDAGYKQQVRMYGYGDISRLTYEKYCALIFTDIDVKHVDPGQAQAQAMREYVSGFCASPLLPQAFMVISEDYDGFTPLGKKLTKLGCEFHLRGSFKNRQPEECVVLVY